MNRKLLLPAISLGYLSVFTAPHALSQSPDEANNRLAANADSNTLEEVLVTARRKEENIQDVPLAITAMSADELMRESISNAQDLMGKVASMTIGANGAMRNSEAANIRGQGTNLGTAPGVVMYWAEVPLPQDSFTMNQGGPGMFFDLQNVQVLKGPQGTLFGRNTTGGALVLEPAKPKDTFSARVQAEAGNYNDRGYEFVVNTPLYSDSVLLRFGGQKMSRDGYTKDVVTGRDYDDRNYWTTRLGLTLRNEVIENTTMMYWTERDEKGTGNVIKDLDPVGLSEFMHGFNPVIFPYDSNLPPYSQSPCLFFNSQTGSSDCGEDIVAAQRTRDNRHVALSGNPFDKLKTGGYINTFSWELNDSLTLRNILSQAYYKRNFAWDQDGSAAALNDLKAIDTYSSNTVTRTAELQLQGELPEEGISYVLGAYYESRKPEDTQETTTVALFFPVLQRIKTRTRSRAVYLQGNYDLGVLDSKLQGWTLTAGARSTVDEVHGPAYFNAFVFVLDRDEDYKEQATTWLASASYQFENAMAYGKVSRGYKAGGYTGLAANPDNFFYDPEYVTNYELGIKSDLQLANMPLRLNGAIYHSDYTDMQRVTAESYTDPVTNTGAFGAAVFNAGKSIIRGLEMDFVLVVNEQFRVMGNYSYTDGEFKTFEVPRSSLRPQADCHGEGLTGGQIGDYSCIPFTMTPEHQYSLSLIYELPIDYSIGNIEASLSYSWVDERYTAPITIPESEPGAWLEDFGLINASLHWRQIMGSKMDLQLFVTNLTDEEYQFNNSNTWNELGYQNIIYSEPRMYGARLSYRFGDE